MLLSDDGVARIDDYPVGSARFDVEMSFGEVGLENVTLCINTSHPFDADSMAQLKYELRVALGPPAMIENTKMFDMSLWRDTQRNNRVVAAFPADPPPQPEDKGNCLVYVPLKPLSGF